MVAEQITRSNSCTGGSCVLVDCVGNWIINTCGSDCQKNDDLFKVISPASGGGAVCETADKEIRERSGFCIGGDCVTETIEVSDGKELVVLITTTVELTMSKAVWRLYGKDTFLSVFVELMKVTKEDVTILYDPGERRLRALSGEKVKDSINVKIQIDVTKVANFKENYVTTAGVSLV